MTRLKALELFGFKSFADRTRFEFPDGITVIVGPNGSGKSNVVDALKWVLGEQSVRSLRGKEMTDVIFAGSAARRALNAAEVSLVFDNSARQLPVDTPDVQIMRRVYRSGESEYLVNGEVSRLRDIRELFSGTGAATEAYSVIEQGRVDALLVASGKDRRAVFEEAAGITRFRSRRAEALRRIERAELNRQRLADIVGEVSSRLETVRHQAARARRWRIMTDRLRALRLTAATEDLGAVDGVLATVDAALADARAGLTAAENRVAGTAERLAALSTAAAGLLPDVSAARNAAAADRQRVAAAAAALAVQQGRRADIETDTARAERVLRDAVTARRAAGGAVETARTVVAGLETRLAAIVERLEACESAARGSHDDAREAREALAVATTDLDRRRSAWHAAQATLERTDARNAEAALAVDGCRRELDDRRAHAARLEESLAACSGTLGALGGRLESATRQVDACETELRDRSAALETAWHDLAEWKARLEACRERRSLVREFVARQDGISEAARRLLGGAAAIPGMQGAVADLVPAGTEWAALVDVALGAAAQGIVVERLDDTLRWHADWSGSAEGRETLAAGGRVGFVAADAVGLPDDFAPVPHPGVVGRLDRLVAADPTTPAWGPLQTRLAAALLGRVWVVERIDHALPLVASAPAGVLFATRDGQTLSGQGMFELGEPRAAAGLVARRAELRAVEQRHDELERTAAAAAASVTDLQARIAEARAALRQAQLLRQQEAETIAATRTDQERMEREIRAATGAVADAEREVRAAEQRALAAAAALEPARDAFAAATAEVEAAERTVGRARDAIEILERSRGAAVEEIHSLRVAHATDGEKLERARDALDAAIAAQGDRARDVAEALAEVDAARQRASGYDMQLLVAGTLLATAAVAESRSATVAAELAGRHDHLETDRRLTAEELDAARGAAAAAAEAVHGCELEAGEARHRRARIVERLRDEYDIDAEAGVPSPEFGGDVGDPPAGRADLDREIEELRRKLASMTTVNLEALAEAEELTTRLATLESQLADVTSAKESIEKLIGTIDEESRRLLGETIETVRGHFRELFERLFGGGQADIVLEDGVDLLETSVEIMARPPGKEPRSISLLSGGEKTMTCVALLLAIFKSRPSPF